jgi:hypothetical protein
VADYDPKRRRPRTTPSADEPVPVDALLDAVANGAGPSDDAAGADRAADSETVAEPEAGSTAVPAPVAPVPAPAPAAERPLAPVRDITPLPAPASGPGLRTVVVMAVVGLAGLAALGAVVVGLVRRRRRRRR